jgi:hypothetical protein
MYTNLTGQLSKHPFPTKIQLVLHTRLLMELTGGFLFDYTQLKRCSHRDPLDPREELKLSSHRTMHPTCFPIQPSKKMTLMSVE